ncbi:hypothetical protein AAG906_038508 [Vitis piasezkii]
MPKTRGGYTPLPGGERAALVRAPLDAPPHLADSPSEQIPYEESIATPWPLHDSTSGLPTKKLRLEPESPLEHLGVHGLDRLPLDALDPARPLRATQIANPSISCRGIF